MIDEIKLALWVRFERVLRIWEFARSQPGDFREWVWHALGFHAGWCHFGAGDSCIISGSPAKPNRLVRMVEWVRARRG